MARTLGDVAQLEQPRLVDVRIVFRLRALIVEIARPGRKVRDGAGRAVAIVDFEPTALPREISRCTAASAVAASRVSKQTGAS